jgi:hypothetical protein
MTRHKPTAATGQAAEGGPGLVSGLHASLNVEGVPGAHPALAPSVTNQKSQNRSVERQEFRPATPGGIKGSTDPTQTDTAVSATR